MGSPQRALEFGSTVAEFEQDGRIGTDQRLDDGERKDARRANHHSATALGQPASSEIDPAEIFSLAADPEDDRSACLAADLELTQQTRQLQPNRSGVFHAIPQPRENRDETVARPEGTEMLEP